MPTGLLVADLSKPALLSRNNTLPTVEFNVMATSQRSLSWPMETVTQSSPALLLPPLSPDPSRVCLHPLSARKALSSALQM